MLHRRIDDMFLRRVRLQRRVNRRIIALRRARGENDLRRSRPDQFRHRRPRRLNHRFKPGPELVCAGRIAPLFAEIRSHRLKDFRQDRCCGIVVEINHKLICGDLSRRPPSLATAVKPMLTMSWCFSGRVAMPTSQPGTRTSPSLSPGRSQDPSSSPGRRHETSWPLPASGQTP